MPHEAGFNAANNPYSNKELFKIYEDYSIPHDPMRCCDGKFYCTYQHGVGWPDDYIGQNSISHWIIEKSQGFTNAGLLRIPKNIRTYWYLVLSSQASARSCIMTSALTAQKVFLNDFEDIVNYRIDIREDIKHYQNTFMSKADYSMGDNIYMLPSDMNLNIRSGVVDYNNKILISDSEFVLREND